MLFRRQYVAGLALLAALPAAGQEPAAEVSNAVAGRDPAVVVTATERILGGIAEPGLRELVEDVLRRNPGVAAAAARARAARLRAPQVRALPDPVASLTAFVEPPETRTGPQRLAAGLSQGLPWPGKRGLRERAALLAAAAMESEVDAKRLALLTEARRLDYELAFLARYREVTDRFRTHLLQHEEIARARYSTGAGTGQGVIRLQAAITRSDKELLEIDTRRVTLVAELNRLRDRPAMAPVAERELPEVDETPLDHDSLLEIALRMRPELEAAEAGIARAEALAELAKKGFRPDFRVGATYTVVDPRDDAPGRMQPPPGNGDDVFGIQAGVTLPVWRRKLAAGVDEAVELRLAAEEARRETVASIAAAVGDLVGRVPLDWRQLHLVEDLLIIQAEEALESSQAGYVTGTLNALDLLDAEHVLFEARVASARARADYLVGLARLEGAIGSPLPNPNRMERTEP